MTYKFEKDSWISLIGAIGLIIAISLVGLIGCSPKESMKEGAINKEGTVMETSGNSNEKNSKEAEEKKDVSIGKPQNNEDTSGTKAPAVSKSEKKDTLKETSKETNKPVNESKQDNGKNSFTKYLSLIGLSKEKLISTLNEKPSSVDEGGIEFKEAGIRIWFDQKNYTLVDQIFIMRKDIDLNGVKIGDKISSFKETFGDPVSDKNGDAHFKYKDIFLSVNYDTKTGLTYSVYILKNDF